MRLARKAMAGMLIVLAVLFFVPLQSGLQAFSGVIDQETESSPAEYGSLEVLPQKSFVASDEEPIIRSGTLNPVEMEHQGYVASPNTTVRTDLDPDVYYDLPLDSAHFWSASTADANIYGLRKIYAVNGTLAAGTPGTNYQPQGNVLYHPTTWDALSNTTDIAQNQTATYDSSGAQYVAVENWGKKIGASGKQYTHVAGTQVLWYQDIVNSPYSDQFTVSFSYLYSRGPLGGGTPGACSVKLFVDGMAKWTQNLPSLAARGVWFSTGNISVDASGIGSNFRIMVGLVIDSTMALNADSMYDGETLNGILNTFYITAHLDDVMMVGQTPPSFGSVDLKLTAGGQTSSVVGTGGNGEGSLVFSPYWTTNPLRMTISSNDTVSFTYKVRMLAHYYVNSSWTTDISKKGIHYDAGTGSANLSLFFYVGSLGTYEDFSIIIRHPLDWSNVTVLDPLQYDVTGSCFMTSGEVMVPGEAIMLFGWWEVNLQSPNYAESISAQTYNYLLDEWTTASVYRSGNITRAQAVVGANDEYPSPVAGLEVEWRLPNGTVWASQSLSGSGLLLNSSSLTIGATNSTAGIWMIDVFWCNGSEIALGRSTFEVMHRTTLTPLETDIITSKGTMVTNFVIFRDADNGEYLMADTASIAASVGGTPVSFVPNLVRNWWEGDFDTDFIDYGVTLVSVAAVLDHYDSSGCIFMITIPFATSLELDIPAEGWLSGPIGETVHVPFSYLMWNGTGISTNDFTVFYQGPTGGLDWNVVEGTPVGNYTLALIPSATGIYEVTLQASKNGFESATGSALLSIASYATELSLPNGTGELISFGENYTLVLRYTNSSGFGIEGATAEITPSPSTNISVGSIVDLGDGYYSVFLEPHDAGTYVVSVDVSFPNYQRQLATFILDVSEIPTVLQYETSSYTVAVDRNATVTLLFTDYNENPVTGATIVILNPSVGLGFTTPIELGNGYYEIDVVPYEIGAYTVTFGASTSTHRLAIVSFQLSVSRVPTVASAIGSGVVKFGEPYVLVLQYNRTDDHSLVTGATVNVTSSSPGLIWYCIEVTGGYELHFRTNSTGTWYIDLVMTKDDHSPRVVPFVLTVTILETRIVVQPPTNSLYIGREYQVDFSFLLLNDTGVDEATVIFTGDSVDWFTVVSAGSGHYTIELAPTNMGTYTTEIRLERIGYRAQRYELVFTISAIPIEIQMEEPVWHQGQTLLLALTLVESDSSNTVANATVQYRLMDGLTPLASGYMVYAGSGRYVTQANLVWVDSLDLSVSFFVSKENHVITGKANWRVIAEPDFMIEVMNNFMTYGLPPIALVVGLALYRQVRTTRESRRRAERAANAQIRQRFNDARNILGMLVLHKSSGLPVYSRSLKPGLDEGIVAAFISAITTFRSEFQMDEGRWTFTLIPISDIVRAVPTKNMIFAMVTLQSPSREQEDRLLTAAREAGLQFDELYEAAPVEYRDLTVAESFDALIDKHLDGHLLDRYILNPDIPLPESMKCLEEAIGQPQPVTGFVLDGLARILVSCGKEELAAYKLVWDAFNSGCFVRISTPRDIEHESVDLDWKTEGLT